MADETGAGYFRGLVTGLLFGAAAALLLAPKKGDDLRQDLAEGAVKLKDRAGTIGGNAAESFEEAVDNIGDKARELKEHGTEALADARSTIGEKMDGAKKAIKKESKEASDAGNEHENSTHDVVESV